MALNNPSRPREEYLNAIRDLADELGRTPTIADMNQHGDFCAPTIKRALHLTWNQAVEEAGLEPNPAVANASDGGADDKYGLADLNPEDVGLSPVEGSSS